MKYIILCGGQYDKWTTPKHLTQIKGEPIVQRTIRLLRECGVTDIAISSNNPQFYEDMGIPIIVHQNNYRLGLEKDYGDWLDAFCRSRNRLVIYMVMWFSAKRLFRRSLILRQQL